MSEIKEQLDKNGFAILPPIYSAGELNKINAIIGSLDTSGPNYRKSEDLFAVRQFIKELPQITGYIFNQKLRDSIVDTAGDDYFIVKSIYFDKPPQSNWFVAYHQDITISVLDKKDTEGFVNWTQKHNQYAVQPPRSILENILALRIHLDDTDENNGALWVLPKSHRDGIVRTENMPAKESETVCRVKKGGVMLMKPLLFHASKRTTNQLRRRVMHIELSNTELPGGLQWAERSIF